MPLFARLKNPNIRNILNHTAPIPHRCFACLAPQPAPIMCLPCLRATPFDGQYHQITTKISMVAAFEYESPLGIALKRIKRLGLKQGAMFLGDLLAATNIPDIRYPLTYIPSPAIREKRRGIDVGKILAHQVAFQANRQTAQPTRVVSLLAREESGRQAKKSRSQRLVMDKNFFYSTQPPPKRAVIIDDVRTTGTTGMVAAKALLAKGSRAVLVVTLSGNGLPTCKG